MLSEYMPGVRSVSFGAWVRAASVHETRERMGVSHLLEHMVFKGTRTRSAREIALSLEVLGGSLDAYTAREHTSFQARVLSEHLEQAVDVVGDLIFRPLLRRQDLTLERKVILEEISLMEDTPDDLVFELHNEAMWGSHPYGYSILGTRDTVSALGVRELRELHGRAYHPAQLVVAAAGNVEHDALLAALERTGWVAVPRGDDTPMAAPALTLVEPTERYLERDGAQTHIVLGSPVVAHGDSRRFPLVLVEMMLGGGMSSRLFQHVREELGLAYSVYTFQTFHPDTGIHGVYVGTSPESADAARGAINEELARLAEHGLSEEEIVMAKSQFKGQVAMSLESVSSRMYRAAGVALYHEPFRTLDEVLALIDAITSEEIAAVCREFFPPGRQTVVTLGPKRG
ncbi:MAG: M16 family metallopeptidase [Gemmatimonadaceae bacterium]